MASLPITYSKLLGRRTLIIGDVGSGKTELTAAVVREWVGSLGAGVVTIIDLAPRYGGVGRGVDDYIGVSGLKYLTSYDFKAPRLMARDEVELNRYLYFNYVEARSLFKLYLAEPTDILVINDLSIYLHYGRVRDVLGLMNVSKTFLANTYYGWSLTRIFSKYLDELERRRVEELFRYVDVLIRM